MTANAYKICGLIYDTNPKSRIEKLLDDVIAKIDGGGGKPEGIGNGLTVVGNTLMLDMSPQATSGSTLPISSNSVMNEIDKAETILGRI